MPIRSSPLRLRWPAFIGLVALPCCAVVAQQGPSPEAPVAPAASASAALDAVVVAVGEDRDAAPSVTPGDEPEAAKDAAADEPGCRSAIPFQPAKRSDSDESPTKAHPATDPRLVAACETIAARSRRKAAPFLEVLSDEARAESFAPLVQCHAAGKGAWTFEVVGARSISAANRGIAGDEHAVRITFRVRPVFVGIDGEVLPAQQTISLWTGTARFVVMSTIASPGTFDWDGDQRAELFFVEDVSQEENNAEAGRSSRFWTFTARGGVVREFLPAAKKATRIADVDGDGRPDVVIESPWVTEGPCGIAGVFFDGPATLLHARADGTFAREDETTHAFIAHQCRAKPTLLLAGDQEVATKIPTFAIGCARWWGASSSDIAAQIDRELATPSVDRGLACFPRAELLRAARIAPPSAFRLSCP